MLPWVYYARAKIINQANPDSIEWVFMHVQKYSMQKSTAEHTESRPRGRPRVMSDNSVNVNIRMTPEQREKLKALGGAQWVREQIERAQLPA